MPVPNLISPVQVTIETIDRAATVVDSDSREPVGTAARGATISIPAQIAFDRVSDSKMTAGGSAETVTGYITVRAVDILARSYTPRRGDRIVKIGDDVTSLYLSQVASRAHWRGVRSGTLRRLYFRDRRPAADSPLM